MQAEVQVTRYARRARIIRAQNQTLLGGVVTVHRPTPEMESERTAICQFDYESFTDSWLAADKNAGGRIPHLWVAAPTTPMGRPPR
jgi:hypothetical protein